MRRWLRLLASVGGIGGVAVAVAFAWGLARMARDPGPQPSGGLVVGGLTHPVDVIRDPFGVPHVRAQNLEDAFRGLGFAHAQDRLWQMELSRRAARGRLAELFGASALEEDRLARTLGFALAATDEVAGLPAADLRLLAAYSQGVNAWLDELLERPRMLPPELRWLGVAPEPWTPEDCVAIVRLRAWGMGRSLGASLMLDRLVREVGSGSSRDFFPERPSDGRHDTLGALLEIGRDADRLAERAGLAGPVGSLGLVVGPGHSASGSALLSNDPHTGFSLPAVFYMAHVEAGELRLSGATWPGVPVFWTGTNGRAAWGSVALHASVSDLFDENFHPDDPLRYKRRGRWELAEHRVETIGVRGDDPVEVEVVSTNNGPLLRALRPGDARLRNLALHWIGQARSSGLPGLLALQRAQDWDGFRAQLKRIPAPVATWLYADAEGRVGSQIAGRLPVRAIETGLLPVTGGSRFYAWRGFVPFDDLPSRSGSDVDWIVASTHPDLSGLESPITWLWSSPGGAERLRERLLQTRSVSLDDLIELQRERHSGRGPAAVMRLLEGVRPAGESAARVMQVLAAWDGDTSVDSAGALVYHVFRQRLTERLLRARLDPEFAHQVSTVSEPVPGVVLARLFDRARSSELRRGVEDALEDTWSFLRSEVSANPAKWSWGRLHRVELRHAFASRSAHAWEPMAWLGRRLSRGPHPAPGDPDSVWTMHHAHLPERGVGVGPSLRYAIDLGDPEHALFGLAGGQSGAPASPYYADGLDEWLAGRPRPLWMHDSDVAYHQSGVWELAPPKPQ